MSPRAACSQDPSPRGRAGIPVGCPPLVLPLLAPGEESTLTPQPQGLGQLLLVPPAGPQEPPTPSIELFDLNRQEPLSKERVAAFSDGVYAIVATLLILDIW